jgi:hypothetical protein
LRQDERDLQDGEKFLIEKGKLNHGWTRMNTDFKETGKGDEQDTEAQGREISRERAQRAQSGKEFETG